MVIKNGKLLLVSWIIIIKQSPVYIVMIGIIYYVVMITVRVQPGAPQRVGPSLMVDDNNY